MPDVDEIVRKIESLEIHGAQKIAEKSLQILREIAEEKGFGEEFDEAADRLANARPTGVSAHNCIEYVKRKKDTGAIDEALDYLETAREGTARNAADIIRDGDIILTHCHSTTVMEAFRKAKEDGKDFKVIVTETEPKLQGLKTAKGLVDMDVPIYYIVDSAAGLFMWSADYVFVGVDSIKPIGVLNKIGTYPISLAAKEDPETEFYFLATKDKFDYDSFSSIEDRPPSEIRKSEELEDPDVALENPAFDVTPWSHFDKLITEYGEVTEEEAAELMSGDFKL